MTNSTFTNNPNRRAKGRIIFDIINIKSDKERLENQEGVYFKFNLHNDVLSTKYKMLLIGPEDSPYVGGFYMFDAQFPDQYPYFPMTMKSRTQAGSIRKHPNLYVNGKAVTQNVDKVIEEFTENFSGVTEEDKESGNIYVLTSQSQNDKISSF